MRLFVDVAGAEHASVVVHKLQSLLHNVARRVTIQTMTSWYLGPQMPSRPVIRASGAAPRLRHEICERVSSGSVGAQGVQARMPVKLLGQLRERHPTSVPVRVLLGHASAGTVRAPPACNSLMSRFTKALCSRYYSAQVCPNCAPADRSGLWSFYEARRVRMTCGRNIEWGPGRGGGCRQHMQWTAWHAWS